ncbi:MAG: hypothetical protein C6Y22_15505 [Hapalosiphonaceae cyanobacterium JJU2]|nr:MAG: hypothetical protein C6Y22_15505 [Hapalosiphonaceae cyanobacterium JJU2]
MIGDKEDILDKGDNLSVISEPKNDFGASRNDFGEPRNDFGEPRNDFGEPRGYLLSHERLAGAFQMFKKTPVIEIAV